MCVHSGGSLARVFFQSQLGQHLSEKWLTVIVCPYRTRRDAGRTGDAGKMTGNARNPSSGNCTPKLVMKSQFIFLIPVFICSSPCFIKEHRGQNKDLKAMVHKVLLRLDCLLWCFYKDISMKARPYLCIKRLHKTSYLTTRPRCPMQCFAEWFRRYKKSRDRRLHYHHFHNDPTFAQRTKICFVFFYGMCTFLRIAYKREKSTHNKCFIGVLDICFKFHLGRIYFYDISHGNLLKQTAW